MPASPFPGMDPYLEAPDLWPDVQGSLMVIFRERLMSLLVPKYIAALHIQIVMDHSIDDLEFIALRGGAIRQRAYKPMPVPMRLISVYIRLRETDQMVTVIELLSPVNKRPGTGRDEYLEKRASLLDSDVHLIEVDLLRRWPRMPLEGALPPSDYLVVVSDARQRPHCDVWPLTVRAQLPIIPVPLLPPDPSALLDIGKALRAAYQSARYDVRIDYSAPPVPPLSPEDEAWSALRTSQSANSPE